MFQASGSFLTFSKTVRQWTVLYVSVLDDVKDVPTKNVAEAAINHQIS